MGEGLARAAEASEKAENSNLPDAPLPLCLQLDRMQRILEDEGHLDVGKEIKASQLGLQLGILRYSPLPWPHIFSAFGSPIP